MKKDDRNFLLFILIMTISFIMGSWTGFETGKRSQLDEINDSYNQGFIAGAEDMYKLTGEQK